MRLYLDVIAILNACVDLLLLIAADRITGFPIKLRRILPASIIGGVYGGMCMVPTLRFLGGTLWRIIFLNLISCIAFGIGKSAIKRGMIFAFLCMGMGGICEALNADTFMALLTAAAGILILSRFAFEGGIGRRQYAAVKLTYQDKTHCVTALIDTGNTLTDPITGEQVLVANTDVAQALLGLTDRQLRDPIETFQAQQISGLRLIPFRSVGNAAGMLLGIKMDSVRINDVEAGRIVAFAPDHFGNGDDYQALAGGIL